MNQRMLIYGIFIQLTVFILKLILATWIQF